MKRVLLDVNVVLDVLLDRKPHAAAASAVWARVETGRAEGMLAAHAITTIHYLVRKERGASRAQYTVAALLQVFEVAPVDSEVIRRALQLGSRDFEDSVTAAAAQGAGCDAIVTRDPSGFRGSPLRVLTPEAASVFLAEK